MQSKVDILIYEVDNLICFMASSVIADGLLLAKKENGEIVAQKIISNSNFGFLTIPEKLVVKHKTVTASVISGEINYEKKIKL